jgi:hypothetical protein
MSSKKTPRSARPRLSNCASLAPRAALAGPSNPRNSSYGLRPHAEAHFLRAALPGEGGQGLQLTVRIRFTPPPSQIAVRLRRIEVEAVADRLERRDHVGPLFPGVRAAEEPLDDAEFRSHGPCIAGPVGENGVNL